jgi:hypothetical protein
MSTLTIDAENGITAHAELPAGADESQSFPSAKELAKLTADWPIFTPRRHLEWLRRSYALRRPEAGKEVHEPQDRGDANLGGDRASCPGRCGTGDRRHARQEEGEESPAKASRRARAQKGATEERSNEKAEVIAMMKAGEGRDPRPDRGSHGLAKSHGAGIRQHLGK